MTGLKMQDPYVQVLHKNNKNSFTIKPDYCHLTLMSHFAFLISISNSNKHQFHIGSLFQVILNTSTKAVMN